MATAEVVRIAEWQPLESAAFDALVAETCERTPDATEAACYIAAALDAQPALRNSVMRPLAMLAMRECVYHHWRKRRDSGGHRPAPCGRNRFSSMRALAPAGSSILDTPWENKPIGDYTRDELLAQATRYRSQAHGFNVTARWFELMAGQCEGGKPVRKCMSEVTVKALKIRAEREA